MSAAPRPRSPWSFPGPQNGGNYDVVGSTGTTGSVYASSYGASLEYWGVQPTLPPGVPPSMLNATYYVSVSQGTGAPKLTPMGSALPYTFRSTDGTSLQVDWSPPWLLNNPLNPSNPSTPPNVAFTAYLFGATFGAGPAAGALPIPTYGLVAYNLADPCGAAAAHAACAGGCAKTASPDSGTTRVTFTGLDPTQAFVVTVVATCNAYWCMPSLPGGVALQSQSFAYNPAAVPPAGPGSSGTPSAGPNPGPSGGGPAAGASTGAIVGGLLGTLAVLGLAGGFVWYRRRGGGGGGGASFGAGSAAASGAEQVVSNLLRSLSPAKAPVAFSSSSDMRDTNEQGLLGAEYAQMGDA